MAWNEFSLEVMLITLQMPSTFCLLNIHIFHQFLDSKVKFIVMGIMFGDIKKPSKESIIAFYLCTYFQYE